MDDNIKKYHQEETEKRGKVIAEKDGEVWEFNSPKEGTLRWVYSSRRRVKFSMDNAKQLVGIGFIIKNKSVL